MMKEGHYTFHFGDNVTIDQIYVLPEHDLCDYTLNGNEECTNENGHTIHPRKYEVQKLDPSFFTVKLDLNFALIAQNDWLCYKLVL